MITHSNITQQGRFGNQLFQIAAAIGAAQLQNTEAKFYPWPHQHAFKKGINETLHHTEIKNRFVEKGFQYTPIPAMPDLDISGYFQSEKYFAHCKDLIRTTFEFKDDLITEQQKKLAENACSIHVRRADYLKIAEYHPPVTKEYLQKAIHYIGVQTQITHFLIFTDDPEWCRENLSGYTDMYIITDNTPEQDMCLMSHCQHHIIANSSFSWWGAWLGRNPQKRIIYPTKWFGPAKKDSDIIDLIPAGWEGLEG